MSEDEVKNSIDASPEAEAEVKEEALIEAASSKDASDDTSKDASEDEGAVVVSEENAQAEEEPSGKKAEPPVKKPAPAALSRKPSSHKNEKEYLPDFPYSFKTVLTVLFLAALLIFIWSVMFHPSMRISNINIEGNYELTDEQIMDALDIHVGDHLLKPTYFRSRKLIRSTPYVADIDVDFTIPGTININVTERHKLAYIKVPDGYVAIDENGMILEFRALDRGDIHPVLCGLELNSVVIGEYTDVTDSLTFQKMILVLGAVLDADKNSSHSDGYYFYDSVREVRAVTSGLIFLTIELPDGTVLQVKLAGIENIADDMQWLLYAIRGDAFEGLPAGSLDMTEEEKIYRAYNT